MNKIRSACKFSNLEDFVDVPPLTWQMPASPHWQILHLQLPTFFCMVIVKQGTLAPMRSIQQPPVCLNINFQQHCHWILTIPDLAIIDCVPSFAPYKLLSLSRRVTDSNFFLNLFHGESPPSQSCQQKSKLSAPVTQVIESHNIVANLSYNLQPLPN